MLDFVYTGLVLGYLHPDSAIDVKGTTTCQLPADLTTAVWYAVKATPQIRTVKKLQSALTVVRLIKPASMDALPVKLLCLNSVLT